MIHPNEIRIGSLIRWEDPSNDIVAVKGLWQDGDGIWFVFYKETSREQRGAAMLDEFIAIPLTPEIFSITTLVSEPFKSGERKLFCAPEYIRNKSAKDEGIKYCSFFFNERLGKWMETQTRVCITYLHQLQNLYFALTGDELKVKLQ